ncbi:hypothetical protein IW146_009998 [Coemansia sp. RSA 922]|nr:hypothetical protein GGH13_006269 [Coemansia sp. S155-1]KAJ2098319.1 hypothetical protein IW146_009998 [Coemansia sp. RSA 922]
MSECTLRCNNVKCRVSLAHAEEACVTKCSHIFCTQCATTLFNSSPVCPACQTVMTAPLDVMSVSLTLTEEYKSAILAGLPPAVIMDICSRAMSFWTYQASQELGYHQAMARSQKEKIRHVESRASATLADMREKLKGKPKDK